MLLEVVFQPFLVVPFNQTNSINFLCSQFCLRIVPPLTSVVLFYFSMSFVVILALIINKCNSNHFQNNQKFGVSLHLELFNCNFKFFHIVDCFYSIRTRIARCSQSYIIQMFTEGMSHCSFKFQFKDSMSKSYQKNDFHDQMFVVVILHIAINSNSTHHLVQEESPVVFWFLFSNIIPKIFMSVQKIIEYMIILKYSILNVIGAPKRQFSTRIMCFMQDWPKIFLYVTQQNYAHIHIVINTTSTFYSLWDNSRTFTLFFPSTLSNQVANKTYRSSLQIFAIFLEDCKFKFITSSQFPQSLVIHSLPQNHCFEFIFDACLISHWKYIFYRKHVQVSCQSNKVVKLCRSQYHDLIIQLIHSYIYFQQKKKYFYVHSTLLLIIGFQSCFIGYMIILICTFMKQSLYTNNIQIKSNIGKRVYWVTVINL
ncbi:hypothetical protein FGO68_gene12978 [Halteria grandinella]|uniref:Transmembrane protein n=1 Tax=Halteria grandinella TaxID=5974 RepID=A0A8J8NHW0_HALGN|nr:hypothetical protein FGO68_gene12978 [Halteria grandinella]